MNWAYPYLYLCSQRVKEEIAHILETEPDQKKQDQISIDTDAIKDSQDT